MEGQSRRSDKPRVLVLATTLPAVPDDGTPQFVLDLSLGLTASFDVTILAPRVPGAAVQQAFKGLRIVRFRYFPARWEALADGAILPNVKARPALAAQVPFLMGAYLSSALGLARTWRPAVVHAHWVVPGGLVGLLLKRVLGVPYVVTGHGADVFALQARPLAAVKRWIVREAAVVGATSQQLADVLPRVDGMTPEVVPMGVDVAGLAGERRPETGRFLFVGRLAAKKGADVLLRAAAQVPEATVVIGGDGPQEEALRQLAATLGLDRRAVFTGRLPRAALREQFRRAHAVVIPSRIATDGDQDTTPLVMSESMSAGVPVIASRLGGLQEQIVDGVTGTLVEPDSVPALAEALRRALAQPDVLFRQARVALERISGSPLDMRTTTAHYERFLRRAIAAAR